MPYAPFYELLPEIAERETKVLTVVDLPDLPSGDYGLIESYCNEDNCDCRRVFINVVEMRTGELKAVIAYGWESKEFYARWLGYNDPSDIKELQGPTLNTVSHQSQLAPALLKQIELILGDANYVERLKKHYQIYKAAVDPRLGRQFNATMVKKKKRERRRRKQ